MKEVEKVIRDGMVAVLVSPGYGAGWSSWGADGLQELLMYDREFVEAAEAGVSDIQPIVDRVLGENYLYTGGWGDIKVEWLPAGTRFVLQEYDGNEYIATADSLVHVA